MYPLTASCDFLQQADAILLKFILMQNRGSHHDIFFPIDALSKLL